MPSKHVVAIILIITLGIVALGGIIAVGGSVGADRELRKKLAKIEVCQEAQDVTACLVLVK